MKIWGATKIKSTTWGKLEWMIFKAKNKQLKTEWIDKINLVLPRPNWTNQALSPTTQSLWIKISNRLRNWKCLPNKQRILRNTLPPLANKSKINTMNSNKGCKRQLGCMRPMLSFINLQHKMKLRKISKIWRIQMRKNSSTWLKNGRTPKMT